MSKTLATQSGLRRAEVASATQAGMTNHWLAEQGLVSIKTLWVAFHYPAAKAAQE